MSRIHWYSNLDRLRPVWGKDYHSLQWLRLRGVRVRMHQLLAQFLALSKRLCDDEASASHEACCINAGVDQSDMTCDMSKEIMYVTRGTLERCGRKRRGSSQPVPYCTARVELATSGQQYSHRQKCSVVSIALPPLAVVSRLLFHLNVGRASRTKASGTMSQAMGRVLVTRLCNR